MTPHLVVNSITQNSKPNMTHYIALTTGPIYQTIKNARKTRELWGASYLFSWLMRRLMEKLTASTAFQGDIIMPSTHLLAQQAALGAGMYGDRMYLQLADKEKDTAALENIIQEVRTELAKKIAAHIQEGQGLVEAFLDNYLVISFVRKGLTEQDNIINTLRPYLDTLELQSNYQHSENKDILGAFLKRINGSFLIADAFGTRGKRPHPLHPDIDTAGFPSIPEISTRELGQIPTTQTTYKGLLRKFFPENIKTESPQQEDKNADTFFEELKTDAVFKQDYRAYHKYIAIVQADGDNMGKVVKAIGEDKEPLKDLQKGFLDFAHEAVKEINAYGGAPIFAGGDDLLFFAPVVIRDQKEVGQQKHIFQLLTDLNQLFKDAFKKYQQHHPALSFGVSISYAKFPMEEAMTTASEALFSKAKGLKNKIKKNVVSFQIMKHSGHAFGATIPMDSTSYTYLKGLIDAGLKADSNLLRSVTYKIEQNEALLEIIGKDTAAVKNFIAQNFNEPIHKKPAPAAYLEVIQDLIPQLYAEQSKDHLSAKILYSLLKTIHFLNEKPEANE